MSYLTRDILLDQKAPAYALLAVVIRKYKLDCLDYEPEFFREEINRDYNIKLTNLQSDKLQAAITVMKTDAFEHDWRVFEVCCHLFNNQATDHDIFNPLEPEDIVAGLVNAAMIKLDSSDERSFDFSDEINAYVGKIFYDYGMSEPPDIFKSSILPKAVSCSNDEKNAALNELFNAYGEYLANYIDKIE